MNINGIRILVVDDDDLILDLLTTGLEVLGVSQCKAVTTGAEALDILDGEESFDILLCDLNMPGMDGLEFFRHLANKGFEGGVAIISGQDERIIQTAGKLALLHNLNIVGTLSKPLARNALQNLLEDYVPKMRSHHIGQDHSLSPDDFRRGFDENEFFLVFQPKVSVKDRTLIGVESLVRWRHPDYGILSPFAFIPIIEQYGMINELTDVVFMKAMQQGSLWNSTDGLDIKVAVNISVDNLHQLDLPEKFAAVAVAAGMKATNVMVEVTESRLIHDLSTALEIMMRLRMKGMRLSIDDFGTGYSSLEQLKNVPFNELKIDRAFVHGATKDTTARAILESSINLAKNLGLSIVAEGVEDQEDWDLVAALGVDIVQGYFIAKPMTATALTDWALL